MIGLHLELEEREAQGNPVRIGLVGAGQMGTDVVAQVTMMKGIDVGGDSRYRYQSRANSLFDWTGCGGYCGC